MGPADSTRTDDNVQGGAESPQTDQTTSKDQQTKYTKNTNTPTKPNNKIFKSQKNGRSGNEEGGGSDREGVSRQEKGERGGAEGQETTEGATKITDRQETANITKQRSTEDINLTADECGARLG